MTVMNYFYRCTASTIKRLLFAVFIYSIPISLYSEALTEYQIKAAFLYNFTTFTEWPNKQNTQLNLCTFHTNPFGKYLYELQNQKAGAKTISVYHITDLEELDKCQAVFISRTATKRLPEILDKLHNRPVLTISDSPSTIQQGVILNMITLQNKVTFEANLAAARRNDLMLSSKLLRLATEVIQ